HGRRREVNRRRGARDEVVLLVEIRLDRGPVERADLREELGGKVYAEPRTDRRVADRVRRNTDRGPVLGQLGRPLLETVTAVGQAHDVGLLDVADGLDHIRRELQGRDDPRHVRQPDLVAYLDLLGHLPRILLGNGDGGAAALQLQTVRLHVGGVEGHTDAVD